MVHVADTFQGLAVTDPAGGPLLFEPDPSGSSKYVHVLLKIPHKFLTGYVDC